MMVSHASRLTALRKQAGLTQADLAQQLGISQVQVSRYEDSEEVPARLVKPWARALGVPPDAILPEDDEPEQPPVFTFDASLYGDLSENLHLLQQYIDRFPQLEESRDSEDGLVTVAQFRDRVTTLAEKPWMVVTGHFDAGKSHLCNFYLGGPALPVAYRPTTKYPTFVHHVADRPSWFKEDLWLMGPGFVPKKWQDKSHCLAHRRLVGSWETLQEYATLHGTEQSGQEGAVLAFADAPLLHSCVLVDLPGYGDPQTSATLIDQAGSQAAVLVYLSRAQGFLDSDDFTRLGYFLRKMPHYEAIDEAFPTLGNLFIVASHVHPGITAPQLDTEILGRGARAFFEHFTGNVFKDLQRQTGRPIRRKDMQARFCSFYEETPARRHKLEETMKALLGEQLPALWKRVADQEIGRFKKEGPACYAVRIDGYEELLREKKEAKRWLEQLEEAEPARRARHDAEVERIRDGIISFKERNLEHMEAVFRSKTAIESLEAMIKQRYPNKEDAKNFAPAYVLEEIQSKDARFQEDLVAEFKVMAEKFLADYEGQMRKLNGGKIRSLFDTRAAFLGGTAGLGTLGALGAWAASLGNLGGYIIVSKVAATLGLSSLTAAGAAGPTAAVAALGGPVVLAVGLAIGATLAVWRLFGGSWQQRLAKQIRKEFGKKEILSQLQANISSFWDDTEDAFQKAADNLDENYKTYMEELRSIWGGSQKNLQTLESRLHRYKELKSFFAAIPWRCLR